MFLGDLEDDEFESEFGTLNFGYEDFINFPDMFLSDSSTSDDEESKQARKQVQS